MLHLLDTMVLLVDFIHGRIRPQYLNPLQLLISEFGVLAPFKLQQVLLSDLVELMCQRADRPFFLDRLLNYGLVPGSHPSPILNGL